VPAIPPALQTLYLLLPAMLSCNVALTKASFCNQDYPILTNCLLQASCCCQTLLVHNKICFVPLCLQTLDQVNLATLFLWAEDSYRGVGSQSKGGFSRLHSTVFPLLQPYQNLLLIIAPIGKEQTLLFFLPVKKRYNLLIPSHNSVKRKHLEKEIVKDCL